MSRVITRKRKIGKNTHHAGKMSLSIYTTNIPLLSLSGSVLGAGKQRWIRQSALGALVAHGKIIVLWCELNPKESWCVPSPGIPFLKALLYPIFKTRFVAKPPSLDLTPTSICSPISPLYFIPRVLKRIICTGWLYLLTSFPFNSWLGLLLSRSSVTYLPVARSNRRVCFYLTYSNTQHNRPCLPSWNSSLDFHVIMHSWSSSYPTGYFSFSGDFAEASFSSVWAIHVVSQSSVLTLFSP